jgi:hypothetical protein
LSPIQEEMSEIIVEAEGTKAEGTACYKAKEFNKACDKYAKALRLLNRVTDAAGADSLKKKHELQISCGTNITLCNLQLKKWEEAINSAGKVLKLDKKNVKALFNRAKAFGSAEHRPNGLQLAKADLLQAIKLDPKSKPMRKEYQSVQARLTEKKGPKKKNEVVDTGFLKKSTGDGLGYADDESEMRKAREKERSQANDMIERLQQRQAAADGAVDPSSNTSTGGTSSGVAAAGGSLREMASDAVDTTAPAAPAAPRGPDHQKTVDMLEGMRRVSQANGHLEKAALLKVCIEQGDREVADLIAALQLGDKEEFERLKAVMASGQAESAKLMTAALAMEDIAPRTSAGMLAAMAGANNSSFQLPGEANQAKAQAEAVAQARKDEYEQQMAAQAAEDELEDGSGNTLKQKHKGYRIRADGSKTTTWSRDQTEEEKSLIGDFTPQRLDQAGVSGEEATAQAGKEVTAYNRGYEEKDMTTWCAKKLMAMLGPLKVVLPTGDGGEGAEKGWGEEGMKCEVTTTGPHTICGEALVAMVRGGCDHTFDLNFAVDFEVKLGAPIFKECQVKGETKRMFQGYPTYRGSWRFPEVSHLVAPDFECVLEWTKKPKDASEYALLHGLLAKPDVGLQPMLMQIVRDCFCVEYKKVKSIKADTSGYATPPVPVAPLPAIPTDPSVVWEWSEIEVEENKHPLAMGSQEEIDASRAKAEAEQGGGEGAQKKKQDVSQNPMMLKKLEELSKAGYAVFAEDVMGK